MIGRLGATRSVDGISRHIDLLFSISMIGYSERLSMQHLCCGVYIASAVMTYAESDCDGGNNNDSRYLIHSDTVAAYCHGQ